MSDDPNEYHRYLSREFILDQVGDVWADEPTSRLGQLLINVARRNGWPDCDIFDVTDEQWGEWLQ